jgi:hypothetical protein
MHMATTPDTSWQYSLRALLLLMTISAAGLGAWRVFGGASALIGPAFVLFALLPIVKMSGPLMRAYLLAFFVVYGPFIVMATYTLLYVSCSHCKETTWAVLPYGPGMVPVMLMAHWLGLPDYSQPASIAPAAAIALGLVAGLTWVTRRAHFAWKVLGVIGVLALSAYGAVVIYAAMRA